MLQHTSIEELDRMRVKTPGVLGIPVFFAIYGRSLEVFPAPEQLEDITVRYHPPIQEL